MLLCVAAGIAFGLFLFGLAVILGGCKQVQYVPVESVRTDSVYVNLVQRDSIRVLDSIYIKDKGDTVWVEKYKYLYRDKLCRDTLYVTRTDSVQVPYPVEARLTRWQRIKLELGGLAMGAIVLAGLVVVGWLVYRSRKK